MKMGAKLFLLFLSAIAVDQTFRALSDWQIRGNRAFFAEVIARADLRPMTEQETISKGWGWNMQSCEYHRSFSFHLFKTCFSRVPVAGEQKPKRGQGSLLQIWPARPFIWPFINAEIFDPVYAQPVLFVDLNKNVIEEFFE